MDAITYTTTTGDERLSVSLAHDEDCAWCLHCASRARREVQRDIDRPWATITTHFGDHGATVARDLVTQPITYVICPTCHYERPLGAGCGFPCV